MQFDFRRFFEELTAEERQRIGDAISDGRSGMTAEEITDYYRGYADYIRERCRADVERCREIIRRRDAARAAAAGTLPGGAVQDPDRRTAAAAGDAAALDPERQELPGSRS